MQAFLSYSRVDEIVAKSIARSLHGAGKRVWLDQIDIPLGADWDSAIQAGLKGADVLIVLLSRDSVGSRNVLDEIGYSLDNGKRIIPVLLEPCEKPLRLHRMQHLSMKGNESECLSKLIEMLTTDGLGGMSRESVKSDIGGDRPLKDVAVSSPSSSALKVAGEVPNNTPPAPAERLSSGWGFFGVVVIVAAAVSLAAWFYIESVRHKVAVICACGSALAHFLGDFGVIPSWIAKIIVILILIGGGFLYVYLGGGH